MPNTQLHKYIQTLGWVAILGMTYVWIRVGAFSSGYIGDAYTQIISSADFWHIVRYWNSRLGEVAGRLLQLLPQPVAALIVLGIVAIFSYGIYKVASLSHAVTTPQRRTIVFLTAPLCLLILPFSLKTIADMSHVGNYLIPSTLFLFFLVWLLKKDSKSTIGIGAIAYMVLLSASHEVVGLMAIAGCIWYGIKVYSAKEKIPWQIYAMVLAGCIGVGISLWGKWHSIALGTAIVHHRTIGLFIKIAVVLSAYSAMLLALHKWATGKWLEPWWVGKTSLATIITSKNTYLVVAILIVPCLGIAAKVFVARGETRIMLPNHLKTHVSSSVLTAHYNYHLRPSKAIIHIE